MTLFDSKEVLLVDIDGTLVDVTPLHVKAYREAFRRVAKINIRNVNHLTREFGKPEAELMASVLRTYSVHSVSPNLIARLIDAYTQNVLDYGSVISPQNVLPGAREMLTKLKQSGKLLVAVSGNPKAIGDALLVHSKLMSFFDATAYSTEKLNGRPIQQRYEILQLGLQRAARKRKRQIQPNQVLVVGDAPSDIKAAQAIGVDSLAVATGRYSGKQLMEYKPTHCFKSLGNVTRSPTRRAAHARHTMPVVKRKMNPRRRRRR